MNRLVDKMLNFTIEHLLRFCVAPFEMLSITFVTTYLILAFKPVTAGGKIEILVKFPII